MPTRAECLAKAKEARLKADAARTAIVQKYYRDEEARWIAEAAKAKPDA